jgi:citrate synthase
MSIVMAASFVVAGSAAFAGSHGGAMKDADKMMADCKDKAKMEKMDDKMKAECKKMMEANKPK